MTIANQVKATLFYGAETTYGTAVAAGGTAKTLRRVTTSLAPAKDVFQSNEARPDMQIADMRHGTWKPGGGIEGELSLTTYDDFLQALLRGTWTAGVSVAAATYTTLAFAISTGTALAAGSTGTITMAAGDPVAAGVRVGDIIRTTGFSTNSGVNFRVTGFGGTTNRTISVTPAPNTMAATAGTNFAVQGNKLMNGTIGRSFTIEQQYPDVDVSELFTGMRVGSGAIRIQPNGMNTCSFTFLGQMASILTGAGSPYFTAPTAAGTNGVFAGPSGALRLNGVEQGIVTAVDVNIDLGLQAPQVVGTTIVPDIFYGPTKVTGQVSAFLQDQSLINAFLSESEVDLVVFMPAAMAAPADFLCINMQRVKLSGATRTIAASSGVLVTFPFSALLAGSTQTAAGADAATIVIQRSN